MAGARNLLIVLSIAAIAGNGQARAGQSNPYLRLVQKSEGLQRLHQAMRITPMGLLRDAAGPVLVPALVRSSDPKVTAEACRRMGGHAGRAVGSILPVQATPDVLSKLATRDEVTRSLFGDRIMHRVGFSSILTLGSYRFQSKGTVTFWTWPE
jgi:hypothetical protein